MGQEAKEWSKVYRRSTGDKSGARVYIDGCTLNHVLGQTLIPVNAPLEVKSYPGTASKKGDTFTVILTIRAVKPC